MCTRTVADDLFEIRKQLADEWSEDLTLISAENAELFRHHHEVVVHKEDSKLLQQHPLMRESLLQKRTPLHRAFSQLGSVPALSGLFVAGPPTHQSNKFLISWFHLTESKDSDSPLRKSNYDLLEKYVTHIAIERVIHEMVGHDLASLPIFPD